MYLKILLIAISCSLLGIASCGQIKPDPPTLGPIKMCIVHAPDTTTPPLCICTMTTGRPFENPKNFNQKKIVDVVLSAPKHMREELPITACNNAVAIPQPYWFIFDGWIDETWNYIKSYCISFSSSPGFQDLSNLK